MPIDFCDLVWRLRAVLFAKDRDVTLQSDRGFHGPGMIPVGGIILWSGAIVDIPSGYYLCDGNNGTTDLRDYFIVGAGSSYNVADTGGNATNDLRHRHTYSDTTSGPSSTQGYYAGSGGTAGTDSHTHDTSGNTNYQLSATTENRPPYYALAFIQRVA